MRLIIAVLLAIVAGSVSAQTETIAYWAQNNNNLPGGGFGFTPDSFPQAADSGALASEAFVLLGGFDESTSGGDDAYVCLQSFTGTTLNAEAGFSAGGDLAVQGCTSELTNNGMHIELQVSTEGYQGIVLSWAQRGTGTGFDSRQLSWSADGGNTFSDFGSDQSPLGSSWELRSWDLSAVDALDNNPDVVFRITLDGATGATGNNRFDNITVAGAPLVPDPRQPIYANDFSEDPFDSGWTDQNVEGNQVWSWSSSFANVEFNPFSSGCQVNDNWLISPAIDLDGFTDIELEFSLARAFSGTNDLLVYLSVDYPGTGLPGDFTWTLIDSFEFDDLPETSTSYSFGPYDDLDSLSGEVHIAFRSGFESGDGCGAWRVTDFLISGLADEPGAEFCVQDSASDDRLTRIHAIQGDGFSSPLGGETVEVQAVVVGAFQDTSAGQIGGFFLQEPDANADDNPLTSEGIYISPDNATASIIDVAIGEELRVFGEVRERFGQTELFRISRIERCAEDQLGRVSPTEIQFPIDDPIALEAVEGMWVSLTQDLAVTEVFNAARFAEFTVATDRLFQPTQVVAPGEAANAVQDLNDRSRLIIDQGLAGNYVTPFQPGLDGEPFNAANPIRVGYRMQPDFEGVMGFGFSNYRLFALQPAEFDEADSPRPQTPPTLPEGNLRAGSFNVENLFTTLQDGSAVCGPSQLSCRGASSESELERQRDKLVSAITALDADVLGLIEVENDDDNSTLQFLVDAINDAGDADDWAFVATGYKGTDAVKNAIIYRSGRLTPLGDFVVLDSDTEIEPPIDTSRQRPVLTQAFEHANGEVFSLSVVHFRSKNCGSNAAGANLDLGDGQGCWNALRTASVESLRAWLDSDPTGAGTSRHLVMGDFNAYAQEDPLQVLIDAGYVNQAIRANGNDPAVYSYNFQGQAGSLDHVLASSALDRQILGAANWSVNADEIPAFAYPETLPASSLSKPEDFYQPDPFRSSDHDPLIVSIDLQPLPAYVQLAHLAPFAEGTASQVEIRVDGEIVASDVAYGDSTGYLELSPGLAEFQIIPAGQTEPAIRVELMLEPEAFYTAIARGDGANQALDLLLLDDDVSTLGDGQFKLRLGHLAPFADDAAPAEIRLADGSELVAFDYGDVGPFVELAAGTYDLVITAAGGEPVLIDPIELDFAAGAIVSAFAAGDDEVQPMGVFALPSGEPGLFVDLNAEVLFDDLFQTYTGEALPVSVSTRPADLNVELRYDGSIEVPVDAGSYRVTAEVIEPGYVGQAEAEFEIAPAVAQIQFDQLSQVFTGQGLAPLVTTDPAGLNITLSFDGQPALPVEVGDYIVTASIDEDNHVGTSQAIFRIVEADAVGLEILIQPIGNNLKGQPLDPALAVSVVDGTGEVVTGDNETIIEVVLLIESDGAERGGGQAFASAEVESGIAVFADLVIDQPGTAYRLLIGDAGGKLPSLITQPFNVVGDRVFSDQFVDP